MAINRNVLVWQMGYLFLVFALPLFLSAGTIAWFAGWSFLVLFFSFVFAITSDDSQIKRIWLTFGDAG